MSLLRMLQSEVVELLLGLFCRVLYLLFEGLRGLYLVHGEFGLVKGGACLISLVVSRVPRRLKRERRWSNLQLSSSLVSKTRTSISAISWNPYVRRLCGTYLDVM
jgi:hypothetical protein